MRRYRHSPLVALTLAAVMATAGIASAAPLTFTTTPLGTGVSIAEVAPEISGVWVAWEWTPGPSGSDIVVHNLANAGSSFTIGAHDFHDQSNPDVSLGRIAYQSNQNGNWDIYVYDTRFSAPNKYTTSGEDEVSPRIDGNLLVWHNQTTDRLWYYDMRRGIREEVPGATDIVNFDVDNGCIVWTEDGAFPVKKFSPAESKAGSVLVWNAGSLSSSMQVHGNLAAIGRPEGGGDAIVIDLVTYVRTNLMPSSAMKESDPAAFHNGAVWCAGDDLSYKVLGEAASMVTATTDIESDPSIFGRRIVYERRAGLSLPDVWMAWAKPEVARTAGTDRYSTAVVVSREYFSAAETDVAVLCTGANFPDALSAAPLARILGGPLLLTKPGSVPAEVIAELDRLKVKEVIIIGSAAAVSGAVESQLTGAGYNVKRLAGANRYETSVKIAEFMYGALETDYKPDTAFFARGDNFPDALAVGPVAAGALAPVLLVRPTSLPAEVAQAVDAMNFTMGFVIGDTNSVSAEVLNRLNTIARANGGEPQSVYRWAGANRYETAVTVVENAMKYYRWIDLDSLGVATGTNFPDALGGGAALGYYGSAVLLTNGTILSPATGAFLDRHQYEIGRVDVFGGTNTVSDAVKNAVGAKIR